MSKPEIKFTRGKGGAITSCRVDGKFFPLRFWDHWCRLDAYLMKLGWKMDKETMELEPDE